VTVTGDQIRMARALLRFSLRDFSAITEVDKGTISRIENGGGAQVGTLRQLRTIREERGVVFLDGMDGAYQPTVALKWGLTVPPLPGGRSSGDRAHS
jgi:transcriptional regulator with XRE-family HTH domain